MTQTNFSRYKKQLEFWNFVDFKFILFLRTRFENLGTFYTQTGKFIVQNKVWTQSNLYNLCRIDGVFVFIKNYQQNKDLKLAKINSVEKSLKSF